MSLDLFCSEEVDYDELESIPVIVEDDSDYEGVLSDSEGILEVFDWDNGPTPTEYYLDLHDNLLVFGIEE